MTYDKRVTISCDFRGCDRQQELDGGYEHRPDDWVSLGFTLGGTYRPENTTKHFCSWEHLAEFVGTKTGR